MHVRYGRPGGRLSPHIAVLKSSKSATWTGPEVLDEDEAFLIPFKQIEPQPDAQSGHSRDSETGSGGTGWAARRSAKTRRKVPYVYEEFLKDVRRWNGIGGCGPSRGRRRYGITFRSDCINSLTSDPRQPPLSPQHEGESDHEAHCPR
jgi:hypothetical protein